ncbi:MAG TPA: hypothetical protein VFN25_07560 [Dokdonella sp.]|uniref:hypothetical protein n=1 Tax=Dokdonella sp. TaxID=2291710 RepID=UPI002D7E9367|nr:hypothetical protein [Dokdonella sp.]HET9032745.1 hypothetical protein [Dokdonella sp.]
MKNTVKLLGPALALIALLFMTSFAHAQEVVRIDGSSDKSVEQSYTRMLESLNHESQAKLVTAIIQLNLAGISSAEEMLADPELRSPGPVRIKDRITGLSSTEIIALANKSATTRTFIQGQEPGVPSNLLTPLDTGKPTHLLPSTRWLFVTNVNGFKKEQVLKFEDGGNLATNPPSTVGVSTWEQSADEVRISINDQYAVSRGKFVDADHMEGTGGNKMGVTWTWTAERQ